MNECTSSWFQPGDDCKNFNLRDSLFPALVPILNCTHQSMIDRRLAGAKSSSTGTAWFCLSRHMKTHFNFMPLLHTLFSSPPAPFHYHHSASFRNLQNLEDVNNSTVLQCFTAEVKPYGRVDNYHNRTHFSTAFYNSYFQSPTCNFSHTRDRG